MKRENEIITITIYKDEENKKYHSELTLKTLDFDKEEIIDLIKHQLGKFEILNNGGVNGEK